ncbi:indolepyruvate oxidoreductase subunit beta family protein [Ramlibacter ginsenosidimutans]|uniref:Indolepyruvate oxidoreductase subunit beta family protein n=1 Tax=Ramlibacter ginsenosidimutans TaxID=502333 RepID=A0A934WNR3_9BURK|nr:indolepyruvate oxidoreductase subunit beta family protein [Ramlibacter ginsenosidimutans]MBK6007532.1 indolepyruvate oxidoreductase subunit beta family protein [Ramlibacter ginsenosidimutans]
MNSVQPIKIAILAMGGEGGGVLADWIVDLGESNGYIAQTTSVPGVAQRTGATIYYVEMYPREQAERDGGHPVLALMPLPGDVDVVLASELMEAGRAVQRGLVTPDRTTLVASTHRVYSIAEKIALGDGRADSKNLLAHAQSAARRFVRFDMAQVAEDNGSVISAVLFGALAGTGVLPFSRAQFESTIERGGVGVKASLRAFEAGFTQANAPAAADATPVAAALRPAGTPRDPEVRSLLARIAKDFPPAAQPVLVEGARRLVDYQDPDYAGLYLDRLARIQQLSGGEVQLLTETARHLALWMSYEDTVRVAELKTRASRFERVSSEVHVQQDQLLDINEYMHPRLQEICDTLPAGLGRWLASSGWPRRLVERATRKGRVVTTSSLGGFLLLYTLAGLKRWRRGSLRFQAENQRIETWLDRIAAAAALNPQLATEVAQCQRLVKGYGDTHERGLRNYETLMDAVQRAGARLAPASLRELRDAALADEGGQQLRAALERLSLHAPLKQAA